jgi:membrane-associated phospholipid phosphatase
MPPVRDLLIRHSTLICLVAIAALPVWGQATVARQTSRPPTRPVPTRGSRGTSSRSLGDVGYTFVNLGFEGDSSTSNSVWHMADLDIQLPSEDSLDLIMEPTHHGEFPSIVIFDEVFSDYGHFYDHENLLGFAIVTAVAATFANTSIDANIQDFLDENVSGVKNDSWRESINFTKELGNGMYTLPAFLVTASLPALTGNEEKWRRAAQWGNHGLRTLVVGAPVVYIGQQLTGGSRPGETEHGSAWKPWQDNNGVSGHAFMGALPFLAAVDLVDNPWYQGAMIAASTLPGISRITDDDHYASQVLLGWSCAYLASRAVSRTNRDFYGAKIAPWANASATGLGLSFQW